jgi:hypothetical protein
MEATCSLPLFHNLKKEAIMPTSPQVVDPQQQQSQVAEQINHVEGNLGTLHGKIDNLFDRFASVLKVPEVPKEREGKDRVELVILAGTIQGFDDSAKATKAKKHGRSGRNPFGSKNPQRSVQGGNHGINRDNHKRNGHNSNPERSHRKLSPA